MTGIFAEKALLTAGWAQDVRIEVANQKILKIESGVSPDENDVRVKALLPALANLHSHTFQRAMAKPGPRAPRVG